MNDEILEIFNEVFENNDLGRAEALRKEDKLRDDLGLDSLAIGELTIKIEEAFGVNIFEDEILETVGEVIEKIEEHN